MTDRMASWLAWGVYAGCVALIVVAFVIGLTGGRPGIDDPEGGTNTP